MMWIIKLLQKKFSDKNIRIMKVVFGLIYIWALSYNLLYQGDAIGDSILWIDLSENGKLYAKYIIISFWFIPLLSGTFDINVWKWKYVRIFQIFSWITLFYISGLIVDSPKLEIDTLIWLMWVFPLLWWITGKLITTKWAKQGYKITKIRV
jgi:hypothetical protein